MQTSQKSIFDIIEETSTSSAEGFLVSRTAQQASDLEKKMTDTSGQRCCDAFERFARNGSWARMFSALLIGQAGWSSTKCRLTWKLKGTKYNRMYFQLVPSKPLISDKEFGLLPTEMLPTPTTQDYKRRGPNSKQQGISNTENWVGMLPTPTARDYKGARSEEALTEAGRNETNSLPDAFAQTGKSSQLNPQFVEEMMGFPENWTASPFLSGETNQSKHTGTQ